MNKRPLATLVAMALAATALLMLSTTASAAGATQVAGIGDPGVAGEGHCTDYYLAHSADYLLELSGDLEGCVYGFITDFQFQEQSNTYKETADETFIGCYGNTCGSFDMVENFHAKFGHFGFCKHPIVAGSGMYGFEGVTGRLDFRDDLDAGNFPYKGHLRFG